MNEMRCELQQQQKKDPLDPTKRTHQNSAEIDINQGKKGGGWRVPMHGWAWHSCPALWWRPPRSCCWWSEEAREGKKRRLEASMERRGICCCPCLKKREKNGMTKEEEETETGDRGEPWKRVRSRGAGILVLRLLPQINTCPPSLCFLFKWVMPPQPPIIVNVRFSFLTFSFGTKRYPHLWTSILSSYFFTLQFPNKGRKASWS